MRVPNVGHAPVSRLENQVSSAWPNLRDARAKDRKVTPVFRAGLVDGGGWLGAPIPCRKRSRSAGLSTTMPSEWREQTTSESAPASESVLQLAPRFFVPALTAGGLGFGQARLKAFTCSSWSAMGL